MALWEYKVITSGPHGFASPALLEAHVNALGKDEWEIIHFQTLPNNPLAFHGLARRSVTRDWSPPPELAVSSPPKPPIETGPIVTKTAAGPATKQEPESLVSRMEEKADATSPIREETLRPVRDTERDLDPDAEEEEEDDWDNWEEDEDDLPTFFEAIKPHLRRNQKGPGMSVAVDYLAKRWEQREADLVGALKECGFAIPEGEETDADFIEFEGDLFWVNRNNRGQLFINTREKPRPAFRVTQGKKLSPDDPSTAEILAERAAEKAEIEKRKAEQQERAERQAAARAAAAAAREAGPAIADQPDSNTSPEEAPPVSNEPAGPMPEGAELLEKIKPLMRRNRRGPGYSGSVGFLARALKQSEADLTAALAALGLNTPATGNDKPVYIEIGRGVYWMNKDNRGGIWINGREKREGDSKRDSQSPDSEKPTDGQPLESAPGETATVPPPQVSPADSPAAVNAPAGEPVPPMTQPEPALAEGVPDREITARPAEVTSSPSSSGEPEAGTESKSDEGSTTPPMETEAESARSGKPAKPRRTGTSRPRTRKPKADTGAESAAVQEDDVAKPEEPAGA